MRGGWDGAGLDGTGGAAGAVPQSLLHALHRRARRIRMAHHAHALQARSQRCALSAVLASEPAERGEWPWGIAQGGRGRLAEGYGVGERGEGGSRVVNKNNALTTLPLTR